MICSSDHARPHAPYVRAAIGGALLLLAACTATADGELTEPQARVRCAEALVASARELSRGTRPELLSTAFDAAAGTWRCEFGRAGRTQVSVVLHTRTGTFEVARS
jgi:hypothetical protein